MIAARTPAAEPATGSRLPWAFELEPAEVRERFRWARRRGHPRYVWSELAVGEWRAALKALERVVASGLRGEKSRLEPREDGPGPRALGIAGFTSGTGPLIGRWLEDGLVEAPARVAGVFAAHLWHGRARAERQADQLGRVVATLSAAGITPVLLKSAHVARAYYPEPGVRPAVDVDVLVAPAELGAAESALRDAGYEMAARQHRPAKSDWLPPGVEPYPRSLELLHAGSHYGVDLQSSLARNFFGVRTVRLSGAAGARGREARWLPGSRVLEQPALLAYLALHASEGLHATTLIRLVDLVLVARQDEAGGTLDWDGLTALLESRDGTRFAYPALALTERLAPGTIPPRTLAALERSAPKRMRAVVSRLTPATAQRPEELSVAERFMWCATPADYGRRLLHMVVPAPAGRSLRRLGGHYAERAYRVLRGRVRSAGRSL